MFMSLSILQFFFNSLRYYYRKHVVKPHNC